MNVKSRLELVCGPHDGESVHCGSPTPPERFEAPPIDGRPVAAYRRVRQTGTQGLTAVWRYEPEPSIGPVGPG